MREEAMPEAGPSCPLLTSEDEDREVQHMVRALAAPATRGDLFCAIMDVQAVLEALSHFEAAFLQRDSEGLRVASMEAQKTLRVQEERIAHILEGWKNTVP